jgi:hypothetical protein
MGNSLFVSLKSIPLQPKIPVTKLSSKIIINKITKQ